MKFLHLPAGTLAVTQNFEQLQTLLPQTATALPSAPVDEQEVYYVADSTKGVVWRFRYRAASTSAYKWEFVGGAALYISAAAEVTTTSVTYVKLTGAPLITVPLAGDYEVGFTVQAGNDGSGGANAVSIASVKLGAAAASDEQAAIATSPNGGNQSTTGRTIFPTLAANAALEVVYRVTAGKGAFLRRQLWAQPVRVG